MYLTLDFFFKYYYDILLKLLWKILKYYEILLDHGIDISCLSLIDDNMLKEIIPKIGNRAKLKSNINEWRHVLDMTNNKVDPGIDLMVS